MPHTHSPPHTLLHQVIPHQHACTPHSSPRPIPNHTIPTPPPSCQTTATRPPHHSHITTTPPLPHDLHTNTTWPPHTAAAPWLQLQYRVSPSKFNWNAPSVHQATSYLKMQIPGPALYVSSLLLSPFPVGGAGQESSTERKDVQQVLLPMCQAIWSQGKCAKNIEKLCERFGGSNSNWKVEIWYVSTKKALRPPPKKQEFKKQLKKSDQKKESNKHKNMQKRLILLFFSALEFFPLLDRTTLYRSLCKVVFLRFFAYVSLNVIWFIRCSS